MISGTCCPSCSKTLFQNCAAIKAYDPNQEKKCIASTCNHVFCPKCLKEWLKKENSCPMCRFVVKVDPSSTQWRSLEIYLYVLSHHLQTLSRPEIEQSLENKAAFNKRISSLPVCSIDLQEQPEIIYKSNRFYHGNCMPADSNETIGPLFPEDIVQIAKKYPLPSELEKKRKEYLLAIQRKDPLSDNLLGICLSVLGIIGLFNRRVEN